MPPEIKAQILSEFTPEQKAILQYVWKIHARPKQLPPPGNWFCWLIRSGRGFGKTRTGAEQVIQWAKTEPENPIALIGQTKADVRDTMIEIGASGILRCSPPWFMPRYEPSKRRVVWPNGAIAIIYSGDEPGQLRGPQHGKAWVDELAKFKYPLETWDNLELGLRLGDNPQVVVTTTPRPIPIIRQLILDPDTVDVVGSSYENSSNLSERYVSRIIKRYENTRLGRQEIHGAILDDVPGALWTGAIIEALRVNEFPELIRIVVAIDPATSNNDASSETGIVVAGLGANGHGYVLDDVSISDTPAKWAKQAISAYNRHKADRIIAESNQGGDMVEHTIRTEYENAPVSQIRATDSKRTRAEPVSALYEQGKIHHVGMFSDLEDQMTQWVPGEKSPDRMDALVWAFTELMLDPVRDIEEVTDLPAWVKNVRG